MNCIATQWLNEMDETFAPKLLFFENGPARAEADDLLLSLRLPRGP